MMKFLGSIGYGEKFVIIFIVVEWYGGFELNMKSILFVIYLYVMG